MRQHHHRGSLQICMVLVCLLGSSFTAAPVQAGTILLTDPSQLSPSDTADWTALVASGGLSSNTLITADGARVTVSDPTGHGGLVAQAPGGVYLQNRHLSGLVPGQSLLADEWAGIGDNSISQTTVLQLDFATPVAAFGANLRISAAGGSPIVIASLQAYDSSGTLLGGFGLTTNYADSGWLGFAGFAGIRSDSANIARVTITNHFVDGFDENGLHETEIDLDAVTLQNSAGAAATPEPSSLTLLAGAGLGLLGYRLKRRGAYGLSNDSFPSPRGRAFP